jgi:hypothetical protein
MENCQRIDWPREGEEKAEETLIFHIHFRIILLLWEYNISHFYYYLLFYLKKSFF